jgi:hypothetical protein
MKPKILLCLALVLSGVLFGCVSSVRADELATNAEPRYLDKSLSEWIPLAMPTPNGELLTAGDPQACKAIHDIGTNALPWLLQWIRSENPETARVGIDGFGLLGVNAKPAVPELIQIVNDWHSSTAWSNAIPALAAIPDTYFVPCAFAFLLSTATNAADPVELRLQVIHAITELGYHMNGLRSQLGTNAAWSGRFSSAVCRTRTGGWLKRRQMGWGITPSNHCWP